MVPVIHKDKWLQWCGRQGLAVEGARFALETCYYGFGWRTRPGTLLVTESHLIHHSYSWRDTCYAMFEPSLRIEIRLNEIEFAEQLQKSLCFRLFHSMPNGFFKVVERNGCAHELVLHRSTAQFRDVLKSQGLLE
jgi:hypothetical protein